MTVCSIEEKKLQTLLCIKHFNIFRRFIVSKQIQPDLLSQPAGEATPLFVFSYWQNVDGRFCGGGEEGGEEERFKKSF